MLASPLGAYAQTASPQSATIPTPEPSPIMPVTPTLAPGYKAPDARPVGPDIVGVTSQPFVGLSLQDAIGMALLKNPDLAIAASNTNIASYGIRAAKGAFDVKFQIEPSVSHSTTAPENAFFSGPNFSPIIQNTQTLAAGLAGQTGIGTQYSVGISQSRIDNNTTIDAFNPYYLASLNVQVTQPLLKGLSMSEAREQLLLSKVNRDATTAATLSSVSTTISTVEDTYWDLVDAWRNVAIQEDALRQAVLQQGSNVRMAKKGAAAPIDAVESSSQVAIYQDNVFSALQSVSELQNQLKSLVVSDPADPIWRANLMPTSPVLQLPNVPTLDVLLADAMRNRPEITQVAAMRSQADVNLAYAKSQALPQVDLQLGYQGNGFAGNALPPLGGIFGNTLPPGYLGGVYGQAYGNMSRFPTYSAGVVISQPIGNNTGRANVASAKEQARIAAVETAGTDQRILLEVRNALQGYQASLSRLYAARAAREASQAVYASEQRKFRNGTSTTFLVTQRQVELVQNEGRELQAQTDLNKSIVELQRVDGSILSTNNVTLQTLGTGVNP
jgi:outer membrane protein TolC